MATDHSNYDPLRNPQVDYKRADLARRHSLVPDWTIRRGVFIELVIWGMFRFMARSEAAIPRG